MFDNPLAVFAGSLAAMIVATSAGTWAGVRRRRLPVAEREDYAIVLGATLTLLGLIIGFAFSMAVGRFEQRRDHEEREANAIGTVRLLAELLPAPGAAAFEPILRSYARQRVAFYVARDEAEARSADAGSAQLQDELWKLVSAAARSQPSQPMAVMIEGTTGMFDAQGSAQAAWWDRIPSAAWLMMLLIAVLSTALLGYVARGGRQERLLRLVLPLVLAITFGLIADIESPRSGWIHVEPINLRALAL